MMPYSRTPLVVMTATSMKVCPGMWTCNSVQYLYYKRTTITIIAQVMWKRHHLMCQIAVYGEPNTDWRIYCYCWLCWRMNWSYRPYVYCMHSAYSILNVSCHFWCSVIPCHKHSDMYIMHAYVYKLDKKCISDWLANSDAYYLCRPTHWLEWCAWPCVIQPV